MPVPGLTLDTGALIALERADKRMRARLLAAEQDGIDVTVPAAVLAEWWRGGNGRQRNILECVEVESLTELVAKVAGDARADALQATSPTGPKPSGIDAIVMASAAQRGDVVYTSDFDDLELLRAFLPGVARVLQT